MTCEKCGYELAEDDKFCKNCGESVQSHDESAATTAESAGFEEDAETPGDDTSEPKQQSTNEYVEKTKETAVNYWTFFTENLKAPAARGLAGKKNDFIFGYINIGVFALFFALGVYFQSRAAMSGLTGLIGEEISFFETFFTMFLYSAVSSVVGAALIFAVLKFVMKAEKITFHDAVARFGTLYTLPVVVSALFFLISIPGFSWLLSLVVILLVGGLQIAVIVTLYSFSQELNTTFDPLYGIFLVYIGFAVFAAVTGEIAADYFLRGLIPF